MRRVLHAAVAALGVTAVVGTVAAAPHALEPKGFIALPAHKGGGGFDHADVDTKNARLYVAHTANDSVDIIDVEHDRFIDSMPGLPGVAGVLVSQKPAFVFTSNRGENSVSIFDGGGTGRKVAVGTQPNGLAFDPIGKLLLVAHADPGASVMMVDVDKGVVVAKVPSPGRTRWAIFDPTQKVFFVNIADPAAILIVDPAKPDGPARRFGVPAPLPHGLALDEKTGHLLCACDSRRLVRLNAKTGKVAAEAVLTGAPDVMFLDTGLRRLYVAIGFPGVVDVIDIDTMALIETVPTEAGAHTIAFDASRGKVYAFEPKSHRAAVFRTVAAPRQGR
jgi:DNA-binding beta-propeller fold protein YncE